MNTLKCFKLTNLAFRNLKVMLAVVFDETKCRELAQLEGKIVLFQYESSNEVKYEE